jgi:hypothetical protein
MPNIKLQINELPMKIREYCKKRIEDRMPRARIDRDRPKRGVG